ncbi:hypothetical protein PIB30_052956, partial [Stylosanthes scabra]|nr:hypothetical protein [Stylosanthes scabra]
MKNEEIMKKSLEAKTITHVHALKEWCARTSSIGVYAPKALCVHTRQTWVARITELCADDLSYWSLKATDGRNG